MPDSDSRFDRKDILSRLSAPTRAGALVFLSLVMGAAVSAHQQNTGASVPVSSTATAPSYNVSLLVDGENRPKQTGTRTVGELLKEASVHLDALDRVVPAPKTPLVNGLHIVVIRVRREEVIERTVLPFSVKQKYSTALPVGSKNVLTPGKPGERVQKFLHIYKNDVQTERTKTADRVTPPLVQIEQVGTRGMTLASRGFFAGRRVVEMSATGYGPGENGRWGNQTASGLKPGFGVVAVDPRFIPLGTRLFIEGYGYAVAGDTGGAIKGNRIDLGFDNYSTAQAVGRRKVRVLILN